MVGFYGRDNGRFEYICRYSDRKDIIGPPGSIRDDDVPDLHCLCNQPGPKCKQKESRLLQDR